MDFHAVRELQSRSASAAAARIAFESLEPRRLLSARPVAPAPAVGEIGLPRYLTEAERDYIRSHPGDGASLAAPTAPPSGPINPVAEYDPMEGLVISWVSQQTILRDISKFVTDAGGRMYIGVTGSGTSTIANATASLTAVGVNMSLVTFFTVPLNSVWARDYGPRYVYEGDVRVITDHKYNRPTRPNDDLEPVVFGQLKQNKYYEIGLNGTTLVHGGGNFHLASGGDAYATRLIVQENAFTEPQIQQIWNTYEGDNVTLTDRFPTGIDATGHIDMWMQIYDDDKAFISDWPNAQGSVQDQICESTASLMQSRGYTVTRIPAYSQNGGIHYTYTNMVIFNNIVLLPLYNNAGSPGAAVSNQVLADVQAAFGPSYTVYQIDADAIVGLAGVFHCIVQHIPQHKGLSGANGGLAPTAYLRGPNAGESFDAGEQYELQWITDDDAPVAATGGVQSVSLQLSTDGGATWPTTIAAAQPALGSYVWTVPSGVNTSQARIRVVATDSVGNTGFDLADVDFTITDPAAPAVADSDFLFETAPHRLSFAFTQNVSASLGVDDLMLENLTTSQTISSSDLSLSYDTGTNVATFTYTGTGILAGVLADGNYRATLLAAGITGPGGAPLPANHVLNFHVLAGDADRSGAVNSDDFNILAINFGLSGKTFSQGNFSYDPAGLVDSDDFNILATNFGTQLAGLPRSTFFEGCSSPAAAAWDLRDPLDDLLL